MRFPIDEDLPPELELFLRDEGHDPVMVVNTPFKGAPDGEIAGLAIAADRIAITQDARFPVLSDDNPIPGLVLFRGGPLFGRVEIVAAVRSLVQGPWLEELPGRTTVVRSGRTRSRKIPYA